MNIIPFAPFQAVNERGKRMGATDSQRKRGVHVVARDLRAGISQAMAVFDGKRALNASQTVQHSPIGGDAA